MYQRRTFYTKSKWNICISWTENLSVITSDLNTELLCLLLKKVFIVWYDSTLQSIVNNRSYTKSALSCLFLCRGDTIKWKKQWWPSGESISISPKEPRLNWFGQYILRKEVWFVLNLSWTICHVEGPAHTSCHKSVWQRLTPRLNLLLLVSVLGAGEHKGLMPWLFLGSRFNLGRYFSPSSLFLESFLFPHSFTP